jgi:transposase
MTAPAPVPSKEELSNLYYQPGQSLYKVADVYHVSAPTVKKWLKNYNLELKDSKKVRQEANMLIYKENKLKEDKLKLFSNYDWLYDQRMVQHKSYETIGKEFGVCEHTVKKWVQKHNIPIDMLHDAKILLENKEYLVEEYKTKTQQMIADELGVSNSTVCLFFKKHGIEVK